ncbi:unnamed protein product [Notodromas monacha]|uniref:Haloacid dehalogenase-like hydrolase domain-containing protein 2 n=1 Tax=Notodromas monacha TaxID=399045 RepID=A0A7R9G8E4_9CRUS|nr:unnamed protein product [Notodromas monacha]CAG0913194.1 unnamed protein product [Notodromas monacha]
MAKKRLCALIDLSGTLHVDDAAIAGAQEALRRLRSKISCVKFVTNTTKESKRLLHSRLTKMGFDIAVDEIYTSLSAARNLLDQRKSNPLLLVDDFAMEEFHGFPTNEEKDTVVVGLAPEKFSYENLNEAFRLVHAGASLIAVHKARYYKRNDGLALGPGPFVAALEYATGSKAYVVGKPEKSFFLSCVEGMGFQPHDCVMIGDDVRDDVLGAQKAGMTGILVKTGKYLPGDETKFEFSPNFVAADFTDAVEMICNDFVSPKA